MWTMPCNHAAAVAKETEAYPHFRAQRDTMAKLRDLQETVAKQEYEEAVAAAASNLRTNSILIVAGLLVISGADKTLEAFLVNISPEWLTNLTTRF